MARTPARTSVFVVYSSSDIERRDRLIAQLELSTLTARVDDSNIRSGDRVTTALVDLLVDSDTVVVIFTRTAAASPNVREELIRAHSMFLTIHVLLEAGLKDELPWFLKERRYHEFSSDADEGRATRHVVEA